MVLKPPAPGAEALRQAILSGELAENGRLLPERALAQRLSVSRAQLRGILDDLARDGLVFRRHGQGTFLQPPPVQGAERLGALAQRVSPHDLMEVRLDLEPALAAHAAARGRAEDKARLTQLTKATRSAVDAASYERTDDLFHYKIAQMAGNAVFLTLFEEIRSLRQAADWTRLRQDVLGVDEISRISDAHTTICDAICAGRSEAARLAMRAHLEQVWQTLGRAEG